MAKDETDQPKKPPGIPAKPDPKKPDVKLERCAKCWERPCCKTGKCAPRETA